ncbi:MAG: aspartate kinase, partial [Bacteroidales bacterium]|nr:aspartate kinase [Bacteroidales bacterium]
MRVFKFGGASVKDAEGVKNVVNIIRQHIDKPLLVVVSAMGKTTNLLEALLKAHTEESDEKYAVFEQLKSQHYQTAIQLFE